MIPIPSQIPEKIVVKHIDDFHGIFTLGPFERGYGVTVANPMRRVLLSSLQGHAITSVRVVYPAILHEFSTIEGVKEDLIEIILNLKQVRLKKAAQGNQQPSKTTVFISVKNQKVFTAGDIEKFTSAFSVTNPELVICHIDENAHFEMELTIEQGRGYVPAEQNRKEGDVKGVIPIDAIFSPIKKVEYRVEDTRVGQKTDYESLTLSIQSDGTLSPRAALEEAARILIAHFSLLVDKNKIVEAEEENQVNLLDTDKLMRIRLLNTSIEDLYGDGKDGEIDKRTFNCLKHAGIHTVAQIIALNGKQLKNIKNLGEISIKRLEEFLEKKGLTLSQEEGVPPSPPSATTA